MVHKKLSSLRYSAKCYIAFASVCELCSKFNRSYSPFMSYDKDLKSFIIIVRAGGSGIVTLTFFSELATTLDKVHILYDFFISPKDGHCTFHIDLMPYERK